MAAVPRRAAGPIAAPRCRLGESPRWSGDAWWWVDAEVGDVWTAQVDGAVLSSRTSAARTLALGGRTSVVQPAEGGAVVVAEGPMIQWATRGPSGWRTEAQWTRLDVPPGVVLNDGTADSTGRLWIGAVGADRRPATGALLRVDRDGTWTTAATGFALSNGMAWDDAEDALLHVDSLARTVWRHHVDPRSGEIHGSKPMIQLSDDDGVPDGIALDAESCLWVAVYGRGEVRRYRPDGSVERIVSVPTAQVTSVALGGPDGLDMLITTAREGFDEERSGAEPEAGMLFRSRAPVPAKSSPKVRPVCRSSAANSP